MKFYTMKSRVTGLYLSNDGTYRSKKPLYLNTDQVNFWIERFTNRIESYKLDETVLESFTLNDPRVEDRNLEQRKTRIAQKAMIAKLKGYQD